MFCATRPASPYELGKFMLRYDVMWYRSNMDAGRYSDELDRDLLLREGCVGWSGCLVSLDQAGTTGS